MPPPAKIVPHQPPPWTIVLAGVLVVFSLVFLAAVYLLGTTETIDTCRSPGILVFIFALAAAIASSLFIGHARVTGALGTLVRDHPLVADLGGGFAIFAIVFFFGLRIVSHGCEDEKDRNVYLNFDTIKTSRTLLDPADGATTNGPARPYDVALDIRPAGGADVFHNLTTQGDDHTLQFVLTPKVQRSRQNIVLSVDFETLSRRDAPGSAAPQTSIVPMPRHSKGWRTYRCEVSVAFAPGQHPLENQIESLIEASFDSQYFSRVDELDRRNGEVASSVPPSEAARACLAIEGKAVAGFVLDVANRLYAVKLLEAAAPSGQGAPPDIDLELPTTNSAAGGDPGRGADSGQRSWREAASRLAFIGQAAAQEAGEATEAAGADTALDRIFDQGADPAARADAIRALSAAIEAEAPESWTLANRHAMLASPLAALQGREEDFVDLLLDESQDVRFEARNFIRKYPVDAFDDIFKSSGNTDDPSLSFAATYFYYSRILSLSASDQAAPEDVLAEHRKGTDWAANLAGPLEADAAVLDYGLSYAYFAAALEDESYLGKAQQSASDFLLAVRDSEGRYLFPRHVAQALAIESGDLETAAEIAASTTELSNEPLFFDATAGAPSYPIGEPVLRRAPLATAEDVGAVQPDQKIELIGRVDGWDLVRSRGGVGWLER